LTDKKKQVKLRMAIYFWMLLIKRKFVRTYIYGRDKSKFETSS